jgi:hydrogenase-4 component B
VGELFIYMAAFVEGTTSPLPLLGLVAPLLAIVGGMALLAFVKLHSTVLLGQPRSPSAHHHGESTALVAPMAILALSCLVLGLAAPLELSLVAPVVGQYAGLSAADVGREAAIVPLQSLMVVNISLLLLLLAVAATYLRRLRRLPPETAPTWGCGYLAPSPRMQYTATSFSQQATHLLGVVARPRCRPPVIRGAFPGDSTFSCEATETILDRLLAPLFHGAGIAFSFLRRLQHGHLHLYMLYIFATLFVLMVWRH